MGEVLCAELCGVLWLCSVGARVGGGGGGPGEIQVQVPCAKNAIAASRVAVAVIVLVTARDGSGAAVVLAGRVLRRKAFVEAYRMLLSRSTAKPLTPLIWPPTCLSARSRTREKKTD